MSGAGRLPPPTCLVTGQPIDTGIDIDEASFARLPTLPERYFVPIVGQSTSGQRTRPAWWMVRRRNPDRIWPRNWKGTV